MNLQELKKQSPADLISQAEKLGIENPSTLKARNSFAILKKLAEKNDKLVLQAYLKFYKMVSVF